MPERRLDAGAAFGGRRMIMSGRFLRRALILWALAALAAGFLASLQGLDAAASWIWPREPYP
jgi:hypothetical protein